jgi:adenylate cyclase
VRRTWLVLVAVLAAGPGVLVWSTGVLDRAELATVDARFDVRGAEPPRDDVVLVGLDDETLSAVRRRPPLPRLYHARVIDRLRAAGARTIAYDVEFTTPTSPENDLALFRAIRRAGNVVLAASRVTLDGETEVLGNAANVRDARATVGSARFRPRFGAIRRLPFAERGLPSFAVAASGRPAPAGDDAWVDFAGPPGTYRAYPLSRVHDGDVPDVRGKIVVVGATATLAGDLHDVATGSAMPGPEVQANAIATLLAGTPLDDPPGWVSVLLVVAFGIAAPLAALRWHGLRWLPAPVVALVLGGGGAQLAFDAGTIVPVVAPLVALATGTAGAFAVAYGTDLRDRRRLRAAFARFVPPAVVDEVVERSGGARLGGVELDATVMFCDLRGFTTLAERLGPQRVIELLTAYLTAMSDRVLDHGGTVVSYLGDGIMAVFGAPLAQDDHADRALAAARAMLGPGLDEVNAWAAEHGIGELRIGIGLCSGPVLSGNVGSPRRLEYAAVGDTTNTAARLQAMTKDEGVPILVADTTRVALRGQAELRPVGELEVRGREATLTAWTLGAAGTPAAPTRTT